MVEHVWITRMEDYEAQTVNHVTAEIVTLTSEVQINVCRACYVEFRKGMKYYVFNSAGEPIIDTTDQWIVNGEVIKTDPGCHPSLYHLAQKIKEKQDGS